MINLRNQYTIELSERKFQELLNTIKRKIPIILIQGGYGKNNLGDDALLLTISAKIKKILPSARIVALCHGPLDVKRRYNIEAEYYVGLKSFLLLLKCDCLIIGGGGITNIINTYSGFPIFRILDMKGKFLFLTSLFVKFKKGQVVFYGVGMTSIPDKIASYLSIITLNKIDMFSARDKITYEYAKKIIRVPNRLFYVYDPALDYPYGEEIDDDINRIIKSSKHNVVINVRPVLDENMNERLIDNISKYIEKTTILFPDVQVILLPISQHPKKIIENDLHFLRLILNRLNKKSTKVVLFEKYFHPSVFRMIFASVDLIIMSRLHGLILSYDFNIPTIVLSYNEKVSLFAESAGYSHIYSYEHFQVEDLIISTRLNLSNRRNDKLAEIN
jgi:polysaccharide pyruvyl transferase WcaK-like protein